MNRINSLTRELCEEIDDLRAEVDQLRTERDHYRNALAELQNNSLNSSYQMIGTIFTGLLKKCEQEQGA